MAVIYYSRRPPSVLAKGKGTRSEVAEKSGTDVQVSPSSGAALNMLLSNEFSQQVWSVTNQGSSLETPCQGVLPRGLSTTHATSRLPKGRQVFSMNHTICMKSLATVTGLSLRAVRPFPNPNPTPTPWPDASQGPTLQSVLLPTDQQIL